MEQENPTPQHDHVVIICADTHTFDAAAMLLSFLPSHFPVPVILALALDERRIPSTRAIRDGSFPLPVVPVDANTPLMPGAIHVVSFDDDVVINEAGIELKKGATESRRSVERFLKSAAAAFGDRLIAVLIGPRGGDVAAGAIEVKRRQGVVILHESPQVRPRSSNLPLPPTVIDHTVTLEQIGPLLTALISERVLERDSEGEDALRSILALASRHSAIDFRSYKQGTIYRRIARRMAVTHCTDPASYARFLNEHPHEIGELVMAFLIKVTEFFRDPEAYAFLKGSVLPLLLQAARARDRTIRVWSVGCATGEEPYSIALLIADLLGDDLPEWAVKVFATDVDEQAIEYARRGYYPSNVIENVPWDYRTRYFEPIGDGHRVSKRLRQMVIFGQQDLSRGAPFPRIDLIVCRNVLIYFKPELQQEVLDLFAYSLSRSSGYLFLGKAETARPSKSRFDLVNKKWKMYRCLQGPRVAPSRQIGAQGLRVTERPHIRRRDELARAHDTDMLPEIGQLRRFNESVLRHVPIGIVVMDRSYRIISLNASARRMLGIHEVIQEQDFLHTARGIPYADVRTAIDTVLRERTHVTLEEVMLESTFSHDSRFVTLNFAPILAENPASDLLMISVSDVTDYVLAKRNTEQAQAEQRTLIEQIETANKRLSELNQELQEANEELQGANEEMTLAQEELQATNEEFEATNEELQATNEELETNNEEIQATNEELEATNDELISRTQELQELTRLLETERTRLSEMIELAPFYILVLRGPSLIVEAYNPRFGALFGDRIGSGRALNELFPEAQMTELVNALHEVYRSDRGRAIEASIQTGGVDRHLLLRCSIIPTHDHASKVDGLVIYGVDVSSEKQREAEERRATLKLMVEHADQVALGLYDAGTKKLIQASPRYLALAEALFDRDGAQSKLFGSVIEANAPQRLPEVRRRFPEDPQDRIFDFTITPITSHDGNADLSGKYLVVSAFEITEQVRQREQLERTDRLKDEFLALASHELRTPLVPLSGYAEMLSSFVDQKKGKDDYDQLGVLVTKFSKQLKHLERMIGDIVDVSRLESGKLTLERRELDVRDVVRQAVEATRMSLPPQEIVLVEANDMLPAVGDESRLVQVVSNLLHNAIKFAPDGKKIEVHVQRDGHNLASPNGAMALIEVIDLGPGIESRDAEAIFTRFFQAKKKAHLSRSGMGLGLFIARALVEEHGGSISVVSEAGKGSNFQVRLPLTLPA